MCVCLRVHVCVHACVCVSVLNVTNMLAMDSVIAQHIVWSMWYVIFTSDHRFSKVVKIK